MIVWITGAKGFIGQHLARCLVARGDTVAGLGHGHWPEATDTTGISLWLNGEISVSNLNSMRSASSTPDVIIHLAGGSSVGVAIANPREDFSRTVVSTMEVLEWVRQESPSTRVVAVSSAAVYGSGHSNCISELSQKEPFSPYGHHKLMMEDACRSYASSYGLQCLVLRLFSVYGPGLRKQLLWDLCQRLKDSENNIELSGTGDELRDWTHVSDVVRAIEMTLDLASSNVPVFNVGSGQATSVREIAQVVIDAFTGSDKQIVPAFNGIGRAGDPFCLLADVQQLSKRGFECEISPREGIANYVQWFCAQMNVEKTP